MQHKLPYKAAFTHAMNVWIDRLPFSKWLFYIIVLVTYGGIQHVVAWSKGSLPFGEFNLYLGFSATWLIEVLFLGDYLIFGAGKILDEFRPMLSLSEEEYVRARYRFTTIPRTLGTVLFLIGSLLGYIIADSVREVSPEINFIFPALTIGAWMLTSALGVTYFYQVIRQTRQIRQFYSHIEKIDLFNLNPLYAFSKMTALLAIFIFAVVYVTPLVLDPASLQSDIVIIQSYFFVALSLGIFYIPLAGVNRRLIAEKDVLLRKVTDRIELMLARIHHAVETQDYSDVNGMRTVLLSLKEEKELIESVPTWPWKPSTFRGLISAILLPITIWLIQQLLSRII